MHSNAKETTLAFPVGNTRACKGANKLIINISKVLFFFFGKMKIYLLIYRKGRRGTETGLPLQICAKCVLHFIYLFYLLRIDGISIN